MKFLAEMQSAKCLFLYVTCYNVTKYSLSKVRVKICLDVHGISQQDAVKFWDAKCLFLYVTCYLYNVTKYSLYPSQGQNLHWCPLSISLGLGEILSWDAECIFLYVPRYLHNTTKYALTYIKLKQDLYGWLQYVSPRLC